MSSAQHAAPPGAQVCPELAHPDGGTHTPPTQLAPAQHGVLAEHAPPAPAHVDGAAQAPSRQTSPAQQAPPAAQLWPLARQVEGAWQVPAEHIIPAQQSAAVRQPDPRAWQAQSRSDPQSIAPQQSYESAQLAPAS